MSCPLSGQPLQNSTQLELIKTVKEAKNKLPIMVNEEIELTTLNGGDMLLIQTYTTLNTNISEIDKEYFDQEIKKDISSIACKEQKFWLDKGVSVRYKFVDKSGQILSDSYIHPTDCKPGAKVEKQYNVFKGNGFSFRYPLDWEIGDSQAQTTESLIRAKGVQTGYSASCVINVSTVQGLESLSQSVINSYNSKIHNLKYLSRIKSLFPDAKITDYNTNTYLSNQPASCVEFIATVNAYEMSTTQKFFQIMTIRKPKRYVLTLRSSKKDYSKLIQAKNMIVRSFLITDWSDN
jgi:hypothetical protein